MSRLEGSAEVIAEDERAEHVRRFVSFVSSIYVSPLYIAFAAADYLWYPQLFKPFFIIRIIASLGSTLAMRVTLGQAKPSHVDFCALLWMAFIGIPMHAIIMMTGDTSSPYYAGLVLVIVGMASGIRLAWPYYSACMVMLLVPYITWGFYKTTDLGKSYFLLQLAFMMSISIILTVGRFFNERLYRHARALQTQLNQEITERNSIIERKTAEARELDALSKQFSPQIVSAVSSGALKLLDKSHRAEICAVFVDIVSSTNKFISMESEELQKILSMYMEDVMGTFLKYDITIDKFLGDGVLAFSNDPIPYADFVERVIRAALEIKERIAKRRDEYVRYWKSEFEISFGIAVGQASVGFYGSDLHVKSYTAIGRVVNLAARLGSLAGPNEIIVASEVIDRMKQVKSEVLEMIEVGPPGHPVLKGFVSEQITVNTVRALENVTDSPLGDMEYCPHGHGLLFLAQDDRGIYFFKCRKCDFVLTETPSRGA